MPVSGGRGATNPRKYYNYDDNKGEYGYISLDDVIRNFTATYIGEGKILQNTLSADIHYHAHRALQELSYDTLKSCKAIAITLPPSLLMAVPHDYVNYTKIAWVDDNGIERILYPTSKASAADSIQQDPDGNYLFGSQHSLLPDNLTQNRFKISIDEIIPEAPAGTEFTVHPINDYGYDDSVDPIDYGTSFARAHHLKVGMEIHDMWGVAVYDALFPRGTKIASITTASPDADDFTFTVDKPSLNTTTVNDRVVIILDYTDSTPWGKYKSAGSNSVTLDNSSTSNTSVNTGERYGLDPQYAQGNGSFFIDCKSGMIHFSSNVSGKQVVLHYISDGHGNDIELIVPKLAEEAMYKWIAYGCLIARADIPENVVQRFRKEKIAETRKAKIRLSNIKIEEITQIMRGKSKFIKH